MTLTEGALLGPDQIVAPIGADGIGAGQPRREPRLS